MTTHQPWRVAAAGMAALAVAMGIGRFAFTPLLPMMLADGVVDLAAASWLATANYVGYLVGAVLCMVQPWLWRRLEIHASPNGPRLVRAGLAATAVLTVGMAIHWPPGWPALRFAAGVASAVVFVYTSGWCLGALAKMGRPAMGALIYTGPGGGIVLSGLAATMMVATGQAAAWTGWLAFGLLAAALTALIWPVFSAAGESAAAAAPAATGTSGAAHGGVEIALLAVGYGLAGFGYIITATFLPVIARQALPGSAWLDLFWPLFGAAVIAGALLASRLRAQRDLRLMLAGCYAVQAAGVGASLVSPSLMGFAAGSLLLGIPFTAITFFAMQEVRRVRPGQVPGTMALLTVLYGLGQIAGPPLAAFLLARSATPALGFTLALEIAAAALAAGAALFVGMARRYPFDS